MAVGANIGFKRMPAVAYASEAAMTKQANKSLKVLMDNFKIAMARIKDVQPEAIEYGLNPTHKKSLILVPKDTYKLHDSGYIMTYKRGGEWHGEVGFAKHGSPVYATLVHELAGVYHEAPTQAFFLEEALNQHGARIAPRIASYMRKQLGGE